MRIQNGDVGLQVLIDGADDAPPILFLHGILASSSTWNWIVPRLVDRYRLLRLDFRGHGDSDRAPGAYQGADYVSDAAAVCEQVAEMPCVVIGHSLGGSTAAGLAQTRPELVRGAVLEEAGLSSPEPAVDGTAPSALVETFVALREMIPMLQAAGTSLDEAIASTAALPGLTGAPLGEFLHDDAVAALAESTLAVDASVLDPVIDGSIVRVFDVGRPLTMPIAAVAADPASPDVASLQADLRLMAESSPHVTTYTLAGASHLIHDAVGQREPFWEIVEGFLASLDG